MAAGLGSVVEVLLGLNVKGLRDGFKKGASAAQEFQKKLEAHKQQFQTIQRNSAIAFGAIVGGIGLAVRATTKLQDEINNAMTLTDAQGAQYKTLSSDMEKYALALSKQLGISGPEVANSFYQVISAGTQAMSAEFRSLAETSLKLAKTVGLETADTVEMLSGTLNAFNMNVTEADRAADVFFTTSKVAATTVPQLSEAMKQAGPMAASMGIEFETTASILAGFAAKNIKGADAGTAFRMAIAKLAAPTEEAAELLSKLGVKVFDSSGKQRNMIDVLAELKKALSGASDEFRTQTLTVIGGQLGFSKLAALLESDLGLMKDWERQLRQSGTAQTAYDIKMQSFTGQMALLRASIEATAVSLGRGFVPIVIGLASKIKDVADAFGPFIDKHQKLLVVLGIAGAGGAGLLLALSSMGLLLIGLPTLFAALTGPIGIIVAALGGLAAIFTLVSLKSKGAKNEVEEFKEAQKRIGDTIERNNQTLSENATEADKLSAEIERLTEKVKAGGVESGIYARMLEEARSKLDEVETATRELKEENERLLKSQQDLTEAKILEMIEENKRGFDELAQKAADLRAELEKNPTRDWQAAFQPALDYTETALERNRVEAEKLVVALEEVRDRMAGVVPPGGGAPGAGPLPEVAAEPAMPTIGLVPMEETLLADADRFRTHFENITAILEEHRENVITEDELLFGARQELRDRDEQKERASYQRRAQVIQGVSQAFFGSMTTMYERFGGDMGKAIMGSVINALMAVIDAWKAAEIAKATIGAVLSFGATLAAIGPIVAAAEAGKGILRALLGSMESREEGGILGRTGVYYGHEGEVVFNPRKNTLAQLGGWLAQTPAVAAAGGGGGGDTLNFFNDFGDIHSTIDIDEATKELAISLRRATTRGE